MRNSSELAESRRLPTACFGLVQKQETESYATQVVDSQPEVEGRGAQATWATKRKLNPFVEDCEASATQETLSKGIMPSERMRGLTLSKPLSLERFVALIMSPLGASRSPNFNKTKIHPVSTSSNSEFCKPSVSMNTHEYSHAWVLTQSHTNHMFLCVTTHLQRLAHVPTKILRKVTLGPVRRGKTFFKSRHFARRGRIYYPPVWL